MAGVFPYGAGRLTTSVAEIGVRMCHGIMRMGFPCADEFLQLHV